ncbi:hypothetical protein [Pontibacter ramchanderi]|nr:hypothetical protein [Pontibacter ramchanderi]
MKEGTGTSVTASPDTFENRYAAGYTRKMPYTWMPMPAGYNDRARLESV